MGGAPTWFGPPDRRLFGWVHRPGDGRARGVAVLCPPLGHEEANALPALQALADRLAEGGVAALRFAYRGTGDSAGWWEEPGRLDDWVASVDEAILFARRGHGGPVVLVGMRMGALLAAEAVARGGKVEGLVLWDPCPSGRDFLRVERTLLSAGYGAGQRGDGSVSGPAFTYPADTAAALGTLSLAPPEPDSAHATLVLARTDSRVDPLRAAFAAAGADWKTATGQADLLDVPPDMLTVPEETVEGIRHWIDRVAEGPAEPVRFETVDAAEVAQGARGAVTERPTWLGPHRLFAMVTDPPGGPALGAPILAFVTAGALDHTGPGRLWVELARQLATEGIRSVRFDIDGIGETFGRSDRVRQVPKPPEAIDDVVDAVEALAAAGLSSGSGDVILVGLSSGAYHAIEAGLRLRLAGVAAVNPGLTSWVPELAQGTVDARRRAFRPLPRPLRALAVRHRRAARVIWRAVLQLLVGRSAFHPVAGVSRGGTPMLLVSSRADAEQFEPSLYWRVVRRRLGHRGLLEVAVLPGSDHSLYTPEGRRDACPILVGWLRDAAVTGPHVEAVPALR